MNIFVFGYKVTPFPANYTWLIVSNALNYVSTFVSHFINIWFMAWAYDQKDTK